MTDRWTTSDVLLALSVALILPVAGWIALWLWVTLPWVVLCGIGSVVLAVAAFVMDMAGYYVRGGLVWPTVPPASPPRPAVDGAAMYGEEVEQMTKHWRQVLLWKDRTLPWPEMPPSATATDANWEAYYREQAATSMNKLALARMALDAVVQDAKLYGDAGLTREEVDLLVDVLRATVGPYGPEYATGLAQGGEADPASIPDPNAKGFYP